MPFPFESLKLQSFGLNGGYFIHHPAPNPIKGSIIDGLWKVYFLAEVKLWKNSMLIARGNVRESGEN